MNDCHEYFQNAEKNQYEYWATLSYDGSTEIWKYLEAEDYIKIFANIVMIVGGLLGNVGVILTISLNKSMWTTINFYVANLAVADAMICIICMIPHALNVAATKQIYTLGNFVCKFSTFTQSSTQSSVLILHGHTVGENELTGNKPVKPQVTCLISSVLTLSAIAFDRFLVVVFPTRMIGVKQRTSLVISIIWITSATISTPILLYKRVVSYKWLNFVQNQCGEDWPYWTHYDETTDKCSVTLTLRIIYYLIICITLYFLPVIIMIFAYSMIFRTVRTRPGVLDTSPGEQQIHSEEQLKTKDNVHSRTSRKVNKMVISVLVAFIVCWTPFTVIVLFSALREISVLPDGFDHISWASETFAYANSFINPMIYGGYNKTCRDGFWNVLRCGFTGGPIRGLARSIRTLTTSLTSSRSRRTTSNADNNSQKRNIEMKTIPAVANEGVFPDARDIVVAIAETRDKDDV